MTLSADYISDRDQVAIVQLDGSGNIIQSALVPSSAADQHLAGVAGSIALTVAVATGLNPYAPQTYINGTVTTVAAPVVPLATLQATAATQIDAAAEAARLLWITNGCGQSLEYNALEAETASATAAPDPLDPTVYPWLGTELAAQIAAGNTTMTLRQVAAMNAAQIAAWKAAGIAIRQTRRTAKLQIAAAPTAAAIDAIVAGVTWPAGPS